MGEGVNTTVKELGAYGHVFATTIHPDIMMKHGPRTPITKGFNRFRDLS